MKSTDHKKIFRADTEQENKKQLNQSEKRKIIAVCAAVAAIAVIFSGVGIGYSVRRASEENSLSFSKMEDSVKGQMQEEMRSAAVYLEKLDESISGNREKLNEVNERLTQREQALLESEKVQKQLEKNSSGMTERVMQLEKTTHTKVNEIQTDMESVHAEIQASLEQISKVIASLEEQKEQDGKDHDQSITEINRVNQSVQEINQSVENIENKLNSSYDGIKGLIEKLQAEETKNQEALKKDHQLLVQSLTDVEGNLKIILETDMTQISQAFSDLTASFQAKVDQLGSLLETRMDQMDANLGGLGEDISGLDQNISGLGTDINGLNQNISGLGQNISQNLGGVAEKLGELNLGVNNSLTLLEQNFAKHMNELSQISGEGTGALKTYLGELSEALKQDLNQVFTSVSNGKTGLASALLTKGVSAENDATFAELKDAVLRIPQKLVIGVEEVPGTITYHYHYHVDGAGENPHTETNPQQGGCYTVPKYHVHSEAAGCYTIRRYHKHNDSCPGHPVWVDWVPNQEPYWGWIYECNDQPINASEKVLNCSKSTSAIDCYNTSCGWVDGQITGAEIVYDKEAAKQRAEAAAKGEPPLAEEALPEESIEQEYPEGGLPFAPPEIADQLEPPKPEGATQPENETKPEDETLPESETEPESEMPSESGTEPESAAQPEGGTTPESEIPSESEAASESEAQPESEAEPESETHAEAA